MAPSSCGVRSGCVAVAAARSLPPPTGRLGLKLLGCFHRFRAARLTTVTQTPDTEWAGPVTPALRPSSRYAPSYRAQTARHAKFHSIKKKKEEKKKAGARSTPAFGDLSRSSHVCLFLRKCFLFAVCLVKKKKRGRADPAPDSGTRTHARTHQYYACQKLWRETLQSNAEVPQQLPGRGRWVKAPLQPSCVSFPAKVLLSGGFQELEVDLEVAPSGSSRSEPGLRNQSANILK